MDLYLFFALLFLSIASSAFFSASETALTAVSRARLHALEQSGDPRAKTIMHLLKDRVRLIGTLLFGNTFLNIAASALATEALTGVFGSRGVLYATAIMTVFLLIFAEMLPKAIAINYPEKTSLVVGRMLTFLVFCLSPVLMAADFIVRHCLKLLGLRADQNHLTISGHEELRSTVDFLHKEGGVERSDRDMFGGLLGLNELTVEDVMIHRTRMRSLNADLPSQELVREVLASPYTRLPLWRQEPDNIIGILHAKDLLRALDASEQSASTLVMEEIAHKPWFVPNTTPLKDQLQSFLQRKTHFALVVDEYGAMMGLITLEDILEEIVGDIKDEHDVLPQGMRQHPDGTVTADGSLPVRDLNRYMDWNLPDEEATTIAGLVIHEVQSIPETGQAFSLHGFRFEILRKSRNRITLIRIVPGKEMQ